MATLEELVGEKYAVNIAFTGHGDETVAFLEEHPDLVQRLIGIGFNGYHIATIVYGNEWKEKLDRISGDYERVWKPLGFTPSHVAKIVKGAMWEEKLNWVKTNYAQSDYTPASVARTMQKKDWAERLGYWVPAPA